ncbi:MAG: response regulator [Patescibacteria group bacterium]
MSDTSTQKKILIVEDDPSILNVLANRLRREGYMVHEAVDGRAGLDSAISKKPDLILLDVMMPRMDGLSVLKRLREHKEWGSKVRVILLTNLGQEEDVERGKKLGALDYLIKSEWEIGDVVKRIKLRLHSGSHKG